MSNALLLEPDETAQMPGWRQNPKIKEFIGLMVEKGVRWEDAADQAGLTRPKARATLADPRVLAFINERRKLHRASLSARIEHTIERAMTGDNARTALEAVRLLIDMEQQSNAKLEQAKSPQQFQINIVNRMPDASHTLPNAQSAAVAVNDIKQLAGQSPVIDNHGLPSISPESPAPAPGGKNPR